MNNAEIPPKKRPGRPASATLAQARPDLAAQLVDPALGERLSKGSNESVEWRCSLGHRWFARVYNRTNAKNRTGCPYCAGKKVLVGFNDVATTYPEAAALFVDFRQALALTAFSSRRVELRCAHGHEWTAPVSRLTAQGSGCPTCSGRVADRGVNELRTTHPDIAAELVDRDLALAVSAGSNRQLDWKCAADPAHPSWRTTPYARTAKNAGCPYCSGRLPVVGVNDLATTHPHVASLLVDPKLATTVGAGSGRKLEWRCAAEPEHTFTTSVSNRVKSANGCPVCVNKAVLPGTNDLWTTDPDIAARLHDPAVGHQITAGSGRLVQWRCDAVTAHVWQAPPHRFLSPAPPNCPHCGSAHSSASERRLLDAVRALLPGEQVLTGNRDILGDGRELDIVLPDRRVAVEFNGVYWHSDAVLDRDDYHASKTRLAAEQGYRLIHVWEDDLVERPELVLRGLAHRLGATHRLLDVLPDADPRITARTPARTLNLARIDGARARRFWQDNHLQGPVGSPYYFGLLDDDREISALLGVGATNHGSRAAAVDGVWDIQRYATCGVVAGGFTRLLKHATAELRAAGLRVDTWTSYSNDDTSEGGMYRAAGFTADKHQPPSYWYVGGLTKWRRRHRTHFVKQRFVTDPGLVYQDGWTEREAAKANGLHRVYDAGKTRWIKSVA